MTMESPLKRRRVSLTKHLDISPIKVPVGAPAPLHKKLATSSIPLRVSKRNSAANTSQDKLSRRVFHMDGANDEDIFDNTYIGREREGARSVPRSRNPTPLSNVTSNRRSTMSASPAPSTRGGTPEVANGKGGRQPSVTQPVVSEDQENQVVQPAIDSSSMTPATDVDPDNAVESSVAQSATEVLESVEPELPTLPVHLGLETKPTPPQGLLISSSPTRNKLKRLKRQKSSLGEAPSNTVQDQAASTQPADHVQEEAHSTQASGEEPSSMGETAGTTGVPVEPSGPIVTWDVDIERKQNEYEDLIRQRDQLRAETELLERSLQDFGQDTDEATQRAESAQLLHLLLSESQMAQEIAGKAPMIDRLAAFLPFTIKMTPTAEKTKPADQAELAVPNVANIPLLQYFAPFEITLQNFKTVVEPLNQDRSQIRNIYEYKIASRDGLLEVESHVETDPVENTIKSFELRNITPWARPELTDPPRGSISRISIAKGRILPVGIALAQYLELALLRARVWTAVIDDHQSLVAEAESSETDTEHGSRTGAKSKEIGRRAGKGKAREKDREGVGSRATSVGDTEAPGQEPPNLGRRQLRLRRDNVALLFSWDIRLDDAGAAGSELDACAACPRSWRDADGGAALDNVGELFHLLVGRRGVREAVSAIVKMVFAEACGDEMDTGE